MIIKQSVNKKTVDMRELKGGQVFKFRSGDGYYMAVTKKLDVNGIEYRYVDLTTGNIFMVSEKSYSMEPIELVDCELIIK